MSQIARYTLEHDRYDEALAPDGTTRPGWDVVSALLDRHDPVRQRQADRLLEAEGAGHLVHDVVHELDGGTDHGRPWQLDVVPYVIGAADFSMLAAAVSQRMRVLDAVITDVHGPQRLMRTGVIPPALPLSSPAWRPGAVRRGDAPERDPRGAGALVSYAVDVVRVADGSWRVVQDLADAPYGLGYTMMGRTVLARLVPDMLRRARAASITDFAAHVRAALSAHARPGQRSPRVIVLSGGLAHPTYVEHSYLATQLGYHLAIGADLVVRDGGVWLRSLSGLEAVDVVYRRIDDAALDPLDPPSIGGGGVAGLVSASIGPGGRVVLANGYGSGLAQDPRLRPVLGAVARAVLGQELLLDHLEPGTRLATVPVWRGDRLEPASTVVRLHAVWGPSGINVMPGGSGRVLAIGDDPAHPTARRTKDVWVVDAAVPPRVAVRRPYIPQVDLVGSLPTRAADALFGLGRAAERAEVAARAARVVGVQFDQDPALLGADDGGWATATIALLRAASGRPFAPVDAEPGAAPPLDRRITDEIDATVGRAAHHIGALLSEALSVREYLSTTTARVLSRLAAGRAQLLETGEGDELDGVLVDLAALAGLIGESTTRGPAWRFLDIGRRLERALAVVGGIEAVLGAAVEPLVAQPLADALLAAHESLVAYRRRHRSDVELDAVIDLLVRDDANPRSLAFQLDRLREHAAVLAWTAGTDLVNACSVAASERPDVTTIVSGRRLGVDALVLAVRAPLLELGQQVTERWFSDPFDARALGARG